MSGVMKIFSTPNRPQNLLLPCSKARSIFFELLRKIRARLSGRSFPEEKNPVAEQLVLEFGKGGW